MMKPESALRFKKPEVCVTAAGACLGMLCAILNSWPAIIRPTKTFPGVSISDSGFVAGKFDALVHAGINPFSNATNFQIGWPSGIQNLGALNMASPLSTVVTWIGSILLGGIATQFLLGLAGASLTAGFGSHFVFVNGGNGIVAVLSSLPLVLSASMNHWWQGVPTYTHGWIYIFVLGSGVRFQRSRSNKNAALFAISIAFGVLWSPYVGAFCLILAVPSLAASLIHSRSTTDVIRSASVMIPAAGIIAAYALVRHLFSDQVPQRTFQEAAENALTFEALSTTSSAFYVGRILLGILIVGLLVSGLRALRRKQHVNRLSLTTLVIANLLTLLAFVKSSSFPTLWSLIPSLVPQIRQGRYAGQIVQIILVLTIGILLSELQTLGRRRLAGIGVAVALVLGALEGNRRAAEDLGRWMTPATYRTTPVSLLKDLPFGVVAHFPWDMSAEIGITSSPIPCLAQRIHHKPIVNLCDYNIEFTDLIRDLQVLRPCQQLNLLRTRRVRYVLVSVSYAQPELLRCLGTRNSVNFVGRLAAGGDDELWRLY